jgi:hypothetical protein
MDNLGNWIENEKCVPYNIEVITKKEKILSYIVIHPEKSLKYFGWTWGMIWILVKYRVFWGMDISMTVAKACDREEYRVIFYAE